MKLRSPAQEDGMRIWRLAGAAGSLEQNSAYAYVLLATHFADTCLIAEDDDELLGFVVAYRPPRQPDTVFVWQVAVAPAARGRKLGQRLLCELAARTSALGVRFVEASVTPDNGPSRALFRSLARELGADCKVGPFMPSELFPESHEPEELFRIGPFALSASSPRSSTQNRETQETTR